MPTHLPQNQFITNPAMPTTGSAVASKAPPVADAAAAPIPVSPGGFQALYHQDGESEPSVMLACSPGENLPLRASRGGPQEAPAPRCTEQHDGAGALGADHIHEIFHYVRKLMKQPPRFVLDEEAFMAALDETPLFVREDGYLRRNA